MKAFVALGQGKKNSVYCGVAWRSWNEFWMNFCWKYCFLGVKKNGCCIASSLLWKWWMKKTWWFRSLTVEMFWVFLLADGVISCCSFFDIWIIRLLSITKTNNGSKWYIIFDMRSKQPVYPALFYFNFVCIYENFID